MDYELKKGRNAVFAAVKDKVSLERVVEMLKSHGLLASDVSVLMPERRRQGLTFSTLTHGSFTWLPSPRILPTKREGPFLGAGPLASAMEAAGGGGVTPALEAMGVSPHQAKEFKSILKRGGLLLSVHMDQDQMLVLVIDILHACGAHDLWVLAEESVSWAGSVLDRDVSGLELRN